MYNNWINLPKQEEILNTDSIEELKNFHNTINNNTQVLTNIIKNSMYKPDGEPNYEIGIELEKKKEELLNKNIDVITAFEMYIKIKITTDEANQIPTLIWFTNRLREIPVEILKAENHSFIKIIIYHLIE